MRMDKLTTKFQAALADAQSLAVGRDNQFIEPVHLMAALLDQQGGTARPLLEKAGAQVAKLRSDLAGALDRIAKVEGNAGEVMSAMISTSCSISRTSSRRSAAINSFRANYSCWPPARTAASWDACSRPTAPLARGLEQAIEEVRGGAKVDDANAEENRKALEKYSIDLTERATQGKLDPVIGRDDEIRRTIQVLHGAPRTTRY